MQSEGAFVVAPASALLNSLCIVHARVEALRTRRHCAPRRGRAEVHAVNDGQDRDESTEKEYKGPRFDPESDTDAFGRDPRKETEFWMTSARAVLESQEVRDAIEEHGKHSKEELDPDREAYLEFIRSLDEGKKNGE